MKKIIIAIIFLLVPSILMGQSNINTNIYAYEVAYTKEIVYCESINEDACGNIGWYKGYKPSLTPFWGSILIVKSLNDNYSIRTITGNSADVEVFPNTLQEIDLKVNELAQNTLEKLKLYSVTNLFTVSYDSECNLIGYSLGNKLEIGLMPGEDSEKLMMPGIFCLIDDNGKITENISNFVATVYYPDTFYETGTMGCEMRLNGKEKEENLLKLSYGIKCKRENVVSKDSADFATRGGVEAYNKDHGFSFDSLGGRSTLEGNLKYELVEDGGVWHEIKVDAEYDIVQELFGIENGKETQVTKYKIRRRGKAISLPMSANPEDYKGTTLEPIIQKSIEELNKITEEHGETIKKEEKKGWFNWLKKKKDKTALKNGDGKEIISAENYKLGIVIFLAFLVAITTYKYVKKHRRNIDSQK